MPSFSVFVLLLAGTLSVKSGNTGDRIVEGNVLAGKFSYEISLQYQIPGNALSHFCGGSIISTHWILTASHCVYGIDMFYVNILTGTNKLNSSGKLYRTNKYIAHEEYNSVTQENDIAVLQVNQTIALSTDVQIIQLRKTLPPDGVQCVVTGWGLTSYPEIERKDLQQITVTKISLLECRSNLTGVSIFDSNLCTRKLKQTEYDVSKSNSGGPLKYLNKQIGIVSFGKPSVLGGTDVYASVPFFETWIKQKTVVD